MKKEKLVWATTLFAFGWLAPNPIIAQQDSIKTTHLNEVVISATKFPKSQGETGKVLTVIDEQQLQRSVGKDLAQVLNEQVGLVINGAGSNPGKDKSVFLRGAGSQYTLILMDGVPVNDPSGVGGAFDLRLLSVDQVARVEILKGSQSTLYGSDAIAGVINIITKKKGDRPIGGFGSMSYGSYNTLKGNAGVAGNSGKVDYNLSYSRFQTDGISEATDESGTGNFDKDGFDQNAFQLNLGISPIQKLSVRPFVRYTDFNGQYDGGAFSDDKTALYTASVLNYGLTGQYTLRKGAINLQYGRNETERTFESAFGNYPYKGNFDHAEVFVNHDLKNNFQLLAGINFQNLNMEDENAVKKNPSLTITSPYASFFVKNLNGFSAEVGGRYNHHAVYGSTFTYSINPSFWINKRMKLFANYSTGFKAPTLNELYGQFGANEQLQPQESKSTEGGAAFFSKDNQYEMRATVFSRIIDQVIVYGNTGFVNLNKQDDYGFELEGTWNVTDQLSITAYYAFVDGEVTAKTPTGADTTYSNLLRRPRNSVGIHVGYQINKAFFVSANLKTFDQRSDLFFDLNNFTNQSVSLAAYQLLDVYAEYKLMDGKLRLFVDAKNVLNQRYSEIHGYNTMPFNVNTGLSFSL